MASGRVRMVFTDVDGTLIGTSGVIPERVWRAAARLRARGIPVALCSGRPAMGITLDYARRLGPGGLHAFQNGASIVHLGTGASQSRPIEPASVAKMIARARRTKQLIEIYGDTDYAFEGDERHASEHARLLGIPFRARPLEGLRESVVRLQWIVPRAEAARTSEELAREFADLELTSSTSPEMPDIQFVMATLSGVNKASAVEAIAARAGVPLAQVMYVGDGDNDVAPLSRVGFPVAMGNGSEKARAAARTEVGSVEEGAAADAFALAL
jgi:Cof subfamily protein (haloacid dehalogenase superfamily)